MDLINKLGIIAGEGKMPLYIAREARKAGVSVYVSCIKGNCEAETFKPYSDGAVTLGLGQISKAIKFFKDNGVTQAVMAGRVKHTSIFSLLPDLRTAAALAKLPDMRAKTLLEGVMAEFKKDGIEFVSSALFLEHFIAKKGPLTKNKPSAKEEKTIKFGIEISRSLSSHDIGLTSVIADRAVIALEGMEGTDRCISRAGELYKESGSKYGALVVVKAARPDQDMRFDLPVVGKGTVESMVKAGAGVLAVESGKTLIMDIDDTLALADKNKISVVGF